MIVSIHIPKTAGTSFSLSLVEKFGRGLWRDYDARLFQFDTESERQRAALQEARALKQDQYGSVPCIHGHFLGIKYSDLARQMPCRFVTWLRHPVERLLSHYYYWVESYDPRYASGLYQRCLEENWSFEKFCLYEDYRNLQSQFLWGLPLESFEFVGLVERFDEDFARFSEHFFGQSVVSHRANVTKARPHADTLDPGLRRTIEEFHSADMALYEAALVRRNTAPFAAVSLDAQRSESRNSFAG